MGNFKIINTKSRWKVSKQNSIEIIYRYICVYLSRKISDRDIWSPNRDNKSHRTVTVYRMILSKTMSPPCFARINRRERKTENSPVRFVELERRILERRKELWRERERERFSFIVQIMVTNREPLHSPRKGWREGRKKGRSVNDRVMGRYRKPRASNSSGD